VQAIVGRESQQQGDKEDGAEAMELELGKLFNLIK
jgi:hypothetical protein